MSDPSALLKLDGDAVDVNVHVSRWPFRRLALDESPALVKTLKQLGIAQAWAGSFDAILHRDVAAVNAHLVETCRIDGADVFLPFGTVNPALPDWEEDLRRCADAFQMKGIRLYPNYHGYKLSDDVFAKLLDVATRAKLLVQIAVSMEDERTQHPLVRVAPVDIAPLPSILEKVPTATVMLLGAPRQPRGGPLLTVAKTPAVSFDIATLENVGGVGAVLEQIPVNRVCFGSQAPFFNPESAVLKMKESPLAPEVSTRVLSTNAKQLIAR